jgi:hypothetical protein
MKGMKHIVSLTLFFSFLIIECKGQKIYHYNIDSLAKGNFDLPFSEYKIAALSMCLNNYFLFAQFEMEYVKKNSNSIKTLNKINSRYIDSRTKIKIYLDGLSLFLLNNTNDYSKCNRDFKKALFSVKKLYKLLEQNDSTPGGKNIFYLYLLKRSSIKKVVKYTLTWESDFYESRHLDNKQVYSNFLNRGYWK